MKTWLLIAALAACKGKTEDKPVAPGSGSAAVKTGGFGSGAAPGSGSAVAPPAEGSAKGSGNELPKECDEWKAMIDKLMACDKMPEAQRKVLKDAYDQAASLWPTMPAASKSQLSVSCKAGADAIMSSAKATCGW